MKSKIENHIREQSETNVRKNKTKQNKTKQKMIITQQKPHYIFSSHVIEGNRIRINLRIWEPYTRLTHSLTFFIQSCHSTEILYVEKKGEIQTFSFLFCHIALSLESESESNNQRSVTYQQTVN
jgi:hypothetical protein